MNPTRLSRLVFVALSAALPCAAQTQPLAVVHTWGDLRAQQLVNPNSAAKDIAPLPTCRLGINLDAAKLYGGIVIYCLVSGKQARDTVAADLGPFHVNVQAPPNEPRAPAAQVLFHASASDATTSDEILFMKVVQLPQPGDYTITVSRPVSNPNSTASEMDASITVKISSTPGPLWSPWPLNAANGAVGLLASDDERETGASGVANPSTGTAIPRMAEMFQPAANAPPAAGDLLPQLLPSEPDPGVQLQAVGSLLLVTLDHPIYPYYPDEKFLTRWWVNGKPFTPKLANSPFSMEYSMRHNGMVRAGHTTHITFQVEFHPEILGVKKSDTIGVQLLLCPQGAEYSGPDNGMQYLGSLEPSKPDPDLRAIEPRASNRVTFPYTGDPLRMAPSLP